MKRIIFVVSLLLMAAMVFTACGSSEVQKQVSDMQAEAASSELVSSEKESSTEESADVASGSSVVASSKAGSSKVVSSEVIGDKGTSSKQTSSQYVPRPKNPATLSAAQEKKIKEEWVSGYSNPEPQNTVDEVSIRYYGAYNGYIALRMFDNYYLYPQQVVDLNIGGVIFHDLSGSSVLLWHSGSFIYLGSAYEQGLITQTDLKDIEYYYRTGK